MNKTFLMTYNLGYIYQKVTLVDSELDEHQVIKTFKRQQILICGVERLD